MREYAQDRMGSEYLAGSQNDTTDSKCLEWSAAVAARRSSRSAASSTF
jgi:hypothetical protein